MAKVVKLSKYAQAKKAAAKPKSAAKTAGKSAAKL